MLYEKYPYCAEKDNKFFVGKEKRVINKDETLLQNNIKNNDEITFESK